MGTVAFTHEIASGTNGGGLVSKVVGTAYVTNVATANQVGDCSLTYSLIKVSTDDVYGDSWLTISNTGEVKLNENERGGPEIVLVRYVYAGVSADSQKMTFSVTCKALTTAAVTTFVYAYDKDSSSGS